MRLTKIYPTKCIRKCEPTVFFNKEQNTLNSAKHANCGVNSSTIRYI